VTKRLVVVVAFAVAFVPRLFAQDAVPAIPLHMPVPVFVTSVGAVNGLTDPNKDNQDTTKDLRENIKNDHKKALTLTEKREDAVIVLVVMSRDTTSQGRPGLFSAPMRDYAVHLKFIFRGAETDMSASTQAGAGSAGAWGKDAEKLGKQVEEWVLANIGK
jgi:opacity protein-like surface antigen